MAAMSNQNRFDCWADFMRTEEAFLGLTKAELRAAIDACDQWASDNAAAFNTAIPQPARSALTATQKARLLSLIIRKRYTTGA